MEFHLLGWEEREKRGNHLPLRRLQVKCRGLPSWTWCYPHHYAPMVSDITDVANADATLHYGEPLLPFEQLLAVLPSACHILLPAPFKVLSAMVLKDMPDLTM